MNKKMYAQKSPGNFKRQHLIRFLIILALIAGAAAYFYVSTGPREQQQVDAAPGEPTLNEVPPPVQTTAMDGGSANSAGSGYLPQSAADETEQATDLVCAPAEAFELFYANFKADEELRIERTRFPLIKRVFSGAGDEQTEEVFEIRKEQILSRDELVYLDTQSASGYSEGIFANDPAQIDIATGPEDSDPLTIHKFQQASGCWFLYEFISYEYSGSNNILAL
jgi:hypothetical protein